uniref:Uncharacterized protein n=1 Tax=Acrobeloides nanus TaxID=290746 RepID=A0A914DLX6_9BILA
MSSEQVKTPTKAAEVEPKEKSPAKQSDQVIEVSDEDTRESILSTKSDSSNKGNVEVPEREESTDKPETDDESRESTDVQEILNGKENDENVKKTNHKRLPADDGDKEEVPTEKKSRGDEKAEPEVVTSNE